MGYCFHSGLHACDVGGSIVFIDVRADRYFTLSTAASSACLRLVARAEAEDGDDAIFENLLHRGFLQSTESSTPPTLCPPLSTAQLFDDGATPAPAAPTLVVSALAYYAASIVTLRTRPLESVLRRVADEKASRRAITFPILPPAHIARAFAAVDRAISSQGRCLPRSIALARMLITKGHAPHLTLGVKLRPFEAHCWVQLGDMLIGDEPGRVTPFTPILVL